MTTAFVVTSAAELMDVISSIDIGGANAGSAASSITLAGPGGLLTLSADLPAINLPIGASLTIDGQGGMLSGGGVARGFYVYAGSVTIENLVMAGAVARGGAGGSGVDGGGGGAGLGAGLFVAEYASVVLKNVAFAQDSAIGGAGGAAAVADGATPGGAGAKGGFGNGGAGGGTGGAGGFGGGGGGGITGGAGGFGGGSGASSSQGAGGGGGLAAGADIFVHSGGSLTLVSGSLAAGTVTGGLGASGGGNGLALGSSIFLSGGQSFTLHPAAGETLEIDGVIADTLIPGEPSSTATATFGGAGYDGSSGSVFMTRVEVGAWLTGPIFSDPFQAGPTLQAPGGTVILRGINSYGSTTINSGTLELGNASAAGTGAIAFDDVAHAVLRVHGTKLPANQLTNLLPGDVIDLPDIQAPAALVDGSSGTGVLTIPGAGTLNVNGNEFFPGRYYAGEKLLSVAPDGTGGTAISVLGGLPIWLPAIGAPFPIAFATPNYLQAAVLMVGDGQDYVNGAPFLADGGASIPTLAGGGMLVLHQPGAVTVPAGYATLLTDATARVTVTGGATDGERIVSGIGGLDYTAGAGAATIVSGGGDNRLFAPGGAGDQVFLLGGGADTVLALGARATVDGNTGGKLVLAGGGQTWFIGHGDPNGPADTIQGGSGAATITANTGNLLAGGFSGPLDFIAGTGAATVLAGAAPVTIAAAAGFLTGSTAGAMSVAANGGGSLIFGTGDAARIDYFASSAARATLSGGAGSMTVGGNVSGALLGGGSGHNIISSSGLATIVGGGAGDVLTLGDGGRGVVFGGSGAETLVGVGSVAGNVFVAGSGDDVMRGGNGGSLFYAGSGSDSIDSYAADTIVGGAGTATVQVHGSGVLAFAGAGEMMFVNGLGASTVVGGAGAATFSGGAGGGIYLAGSGAQSLAGGSGTSLLIAGAGADTLAGGDGLTLFSFQAGRVGGFQVVTGWDPTHDSINLAGFGSLPTSGLAGIISGGGSSLVTLTDGTHILFADATSLSASNFI